MTRRSAVALLLVFVGTLVGCASPEPSGSGGAAACALEVRYRGHTYVGHGSEVAPLEGEPLGTAVLPACNDTDVPKGARDNAERIEVARLPGVPPRIAVVWPGHLNTVLVREGVRDLPPEVARLLDAPRCDPADAPIRLAGQWLGIVEPGGNTELDLVPPYNLSLFVRHASPPRYLRAFLDVRVPPALGRPLTREDVRSSLWEGGDIAIVASCSGRRYVAQSVRVPSRG